MKLYVIRHGQTEWNVLKKMQGSIDIPLNQKGIDQAYETKKRVDNINIDIIYCSPLVRAKQTAEIINEKRNIKVVYDERLKERNYGEFEGTQKTSFNYNDFWAYRKNLDWQKAENVQEFFNRIYNLLDEISKKHANQNVLIVSHAGVMKAVECYFNGIMHDEDIGPYLPENSSIKEYKKEN